MFFSISNKYRSVNWQILQLKYANELASTKTFTEHKSKILTDHNVHLALFSRLTLSQSQIDHQRINVLQLQSCSSRIYP